MYRLVHVRSWQGFCSPADVATYVLRTAQHAPLLKPSPCRTAVRSAGAVCIRATTPPGGVRHPGRGGASLGRREWCYTRSLGPPAGLTSSRCLLPTSHLPLPSPLLLPQPLCSTAFFSPPLSSHRPPLPSLPHLPACPCCPCCPPCLQSCAVDPGGVRTAIWDEVPALAVPPAKWVSAARFAVCA